MKKNKIYILGGALVFVLFLGGCKNLSNLKNEIMKEFCKEELLLISNSPDGCYIVEVYRTEPSATVDFSVKAYVLDQNEKVLIYNAYHESNAEIVWISNNVISINGEKLDLLSGEIYDWRNS